MGDVGNFFMGGSKNKNKSSQSSSSQNSSQSQSQSSNLQGSNSISESGSNSNSKSGNQAYGAVSSALSPSLGYVNSAGSMLGSLLGLPAPAAAPVSMPSSGGGVPPTGGTSGGTSTGGHMSGSQLNDLVWNNLISRLNSIHLPQAHPTPTPVPTPNPIPPTSSVPPIQTSPVVPTSGPYGGGGSPRPPVYKAMGGPVTANQPYIVGEHRPEVFVPHTSGTIVPSVPSGLGSLLNRHGGGSRSPVPPGTPMPGQTPPIMAPGVMPTAQPPAVTPPLSQNDALNGYANGAGMNFMLDQGQKAISGASAANGTFNSGATGKALEQFGMNTGKTYLDDYINHLFDYAKLGLGSASAMSGAGGYSNANSNSFGNSSSGSFGMGNSSSNANSQGSSQSTGSSSGSGNSKKGLLPDLAAFGSGG